MAKKWQGGTVWTNSSKPLTPLGWPVGCTLLLGKIPSDSDTQLSYSLLGDSFPLRGNVSKVLCSFMVTAFRHGIKEWKETWPDFQESHEKNGTDSDKNNMNVNMHRWILMNGGKTMSCGSQMAKVWTLAHYSPTTASFITLTKPQFPLLKTE